MQNAPQSKLTPKLQSYCDSLPAEFDQIDENRKKVLDEVSNYIKKNIEASGNCRLMFICSHNSRRSQFGQVWTTTAAQYYGISGISSFSGGIEVTACNSRTISTLERVGFLTEKKSEDVNPHYEVKAGKELLGNFLFSKLYGDLFNPRSNFAAIMVCSDADEKCPLVSGAEERISLPYDDPKAFDNTALETNKYDERCRQIAREVFYIFSKL